MRRRYTPLLGVVVLLVILVSAGAGAGAGVLLAGDQTVEARNDSDAAGRAEAFRTTAVASGTAQTITVYVDSSSAATKLTAGLYSNTSGRPGALLAQGTISSPARGAWNDVPIAGTAVTSGVTYWIAVLGPAGTGTLQFRDACCAGASETSSQTTLASLPATWTTGTRYTDGPLSAYVSGATSATPALQVAPTAISFGGTAGGVDPGAAQVSVSNSGTGTLSFSAVSDSPWLAVSPPSGAAPASLSISVALAGLVPATYVGHVTVTAPGAAGSPATITVTLVVAPQAQPSALDWPQVDRDPGRTGDAVGETTISPANASTLARSWAQAVDGKVTAQPLFLKSVTVGGAQRDVVIAATSANSVYALDAATGAVVWRRNFGARASNCAIPGGFGVTAAPAVDKANGRIYAVADNGTLYTLALADGTDAASPLPLVIGPTTNKVWGGLNLHGGDLYVATASDGCDTPPWRGRVYHVGVSGSNPQLLGTWDVVPGIAAPAGGGGIWGYGGVSVDLVDGHVYAATAADSTELYTLWANRLVALDGGLAVVGSYGPPEPTTFPCSGAPCDLDFGATPVVFQPAGCPTMTAAGNKNGNLYVFRTAGLAASAAPDQVLQLNGANDWLGSGGVGGVPAYWGAGRMLFVVDAGSGFGGVAGGVIGLTVQTDCTLRVAWSAPLGGNTLPNSTPTVANGVVFAGAGSGGAVHGYDARTGAELWTSGAIGSGSTFAAPIVADGRLFVGSWDGSAAGDAGTIRAYAPGQLDTTPPTVSITAPAGGATVSGTVTVGATAADNVGVAGVQFKLDGANLGTEDTSAPYSVSWDTTTAAAGTHALTAVAHDAAGNTRTSAAVSVNVDNTAPPPPPRVLLGDQAIEAASDSNTGGRAEAFRATATSTGAVSRLSVYVGSGSTATTVVVGLYADAAGKPGALLTQAAVTTAARGAWVDVPVPSAAVTNGSTYWIALLSPLGGGTLQFRDKPGGASETSASSSLTALPATWATGVRYTDGPVSAYGSGS